MLKSSFIAKVGDDVKIFFFC